MEPYLYDGDRVLTFNIIVPKVGDIVVFKNKGHYLIKRVRKISKHKFFLEGDNQKLSSKIEPVVIDQIVGKVILKY